MSRRLTLMGAFKNLNETDEFFNIDDDMLGTMWDHVYGGNRPDRNTMLRDMDKFRQEQGLDNLEDVWNLISDEYGGLGEMKNIFTENLKRLSNVHHNRGLDKGNKELL